MSQAELSVGFMRLITDRLEVETERGDSPTISTAMTVFMSKWLADALRFPFRTVRGYVKSVFLALEQGRATWRDTDKIREIRTEAIEGTTRLEEAPSQPAVAARATTAKPIATGWCADYQNGKCTFTSQTHETSRGQVSHICAFCYRTQGKEFQHAQDVCKNKEKVRSKNI
jgi:hypothetical protein